LVEVPQPAPAAVAARSKLSSMTLAVAADEPGTATIATAPAANAASTRPDSQGIRAMLT